MRKNNLEGSYAFTHNGTFHADDVLAASLLRLLKPELKIVRGNVVPNDFPGIVFDIGSGRYDHISPRPIQRYARQESSTPPLGCCGMILEKPLWMPPMRMRLILRLSLRLIGVITRLIPTCCLL